MSEDLAWVDAVGQAEMVRRREVHPRELVGAAIARIEVRNPALNAVIHPLYDKAMAVAEAAPDGPLRGVPFLLKDGLCHSAGDPCHEGMRVLRDAGWVEAEDTYLAARYRAAGLMLCGRTNLPELATAPITEPLAYGPTLNPWDHGRTPGGSSGGSAAAVASGMVPVAHGSDMGGSIRVPASCCGIVGLKPTRGRTTLGPDHGEYWGPLTHQHVLTRTVRDTAKVLDVTAGPAPGDRYAAAPPARPFSDAVGADPGELRIGVRTRRPDGLGEADPECVAAVESTAGLLEAAGHRVQAVELQALDDPVLSRAFLDVMSAAVARDLSHWGARLGRPIGVDELEPHNQMFAQAGMTLTATAYLEALELLNRYSRHVARAWQEFDVLLTPTLPVPPIPSGSGDAQDPAAGMARIAGLVTFTMPFNATGQPAISLPLHWDDQGLPIGIQLVAEMGREDVLLMLAGQLEEARPWAGRRPPTA